MTIPELAKILQKHKTLSEEQFNDTYLQLQEAANTEGAYTILKNTEIRNTGFFVLGANSDTIKALTSIKVENIRFPYLLSNFLLAKICQDTSFNKDTMNDIATIITNMAESKAITFNSQNYSNSKHTMPNTFSFDIGFTIGHCLSHGIDCTHLLKIYQPDIVMDHKLFVNGIAAGSFRESKGLMFNETYSKNLGKYWLNDSSHKTAVIKTFQHVTKTNDQRQLSAVNERTTWFLNTLLPKSKVVRDLHEQHLEVAKKVYEQNIHSPEFAAYFEQCLIEKSEQLTDQIEQKYQQTLDKEIARIEQKAIDNAHTILEEQKVIKETKEFEEKSLAFKQKLNRML